MESKTPVLLAAGAAILAAVGGVTFAVVRTDPTPNPPIAVVTPSPSPTTQASPLNAPASPKPSVSPEASPPVTPEPEPSVTPAPSPAPEARKTVESCVIQMARVNDPNPPLNVRSSPNTSADNVTGQLRNGTFVTVVDEAQGWFRISTPTKGWISRSMTESTCNQKVERVQFAPDTDSVSISDRFIGTGSHAYKMNLGQGQTLTVSSSRGPLPIVLGPDGKTLNLDVDRDNTKTWTTQLPASGDYTLSQESNFKGYRYAFSIQVK